MATRTDQLVDDYLARVARHAAALPHERRDELLAELTEHIATARAETETPDAEATVRTILDRLGDPAEIVAQETVTPVRVDAAPDRAWYRPVTLACLLLGGLVVPVVGWVAGVVLLWGGGRWSTRQRILGTVCTPGGFGTAFLTAALWFLFADGSDSGVCRTGTQCTASSGSLGAATIALLVALACAAASVVAVAVLARSGRRG